jgi:hypothetical protein
VAPCATGGMNERVLLLLRRLTGLYNLEIGECSVFDPDEPNTPILFGCRWLTELCRWRAVFSLLYVLSFGSL